MIGAKRPCNFSFVMNERRKQSRQQRRLRVSLGKVAVFTADVCDEGFCAELIHVLEPGHPVSGRVSVGSHEYPFLGTVTWARHGDPQLGLRGRMGVHFESIDDHFLAAYHHAFPMPAKSPGLSAGAAGPR